MKLKATFVALAFAAGITASIAVAGPPPGHGHGKHDSTASSTSSTGSTVAAPSCRPKVSMILKGDYVGAGADGSSFAMNVKQANKHGRDFAGTQVSVMVDAQTKFRRNGPAKLADFVAGDRLNVQVRACFAHGHGKRSAAPADPSQQPVLLAKRVVGHPASGGDDDGDGGSTTGSTSTGTTDTTPTATTGSTDTSTTGTTGTTP